MSSMLEQAVIDAAALKEVALKNAEAAVVEKYSSEVKEAMRTLLEQEDDMDLDDLDTDLTGEDDMEAEEDSVVDSVPLAATDGEDMCPCPDEEEVIVLDFDDLAKQMDDEESMPGEMIDAEDTAEELLDDEGELDLDDIDLQESIKGILGLDEAGAKPDFLDLDKDGDKEESMKDAAEDAKEKLDEDADDDEDQDDLDEEIDLSEEQLEEIVGALEEKLTVDIDDVLTGWAGRPQSDQKLAAEKILAHMQDDEVKEEEGLSKEAVEQVEELMEAKRELEEKISNITEHNTKLTTAVVALKEHVEEVNAANAKLLYTNRVLTSDSLNERQKNKIVEAISNANTVEEAKVIFETLQSAVGSTDKKQPKSLSEAVDRSSTHVMSSRNSSKRRNSEVDPAVTRWQLLAGLKQK